MAKIVNDKYYTSIELAEYCYRKTLEVLSGENITEIVEPAAGNGVFLDCDSSIIGYDIESEDSRVILSDFIGNDFAMEYKEGRLFIGNPPFGSRMTKATQFFKKSTKLGDYIAYILPISQFENTSSLYEFDLVYSEDLGVKEYSGINLHCVFNIYKRPISGLCNSKKVSKLKQVKIYRNDCKDYKEIKYDVRLGYWGDGVIGRVLGEEDRFYAGEYKICVYDLEHKEEIIDFIKTYNWKEEVKGISMKRLRQFQIIDILCSKFTFLY